MDGRVKAAIRILSDAAQDMHGPGHQEDVSRASVQVEQSTRGGFRRLYLVTRDSAGGWGEPRALAQEFGMAARWCPVGPLIAYIGGRYGLQVIDSRGKTSPRELLGPSNWPAMHGAPGRVDWSSDGGTLYFNSFDTAGAFSVWAIPVEGGKPRRLLRVDHRSVYQEFALRDERLYFTVDERSSDIKILELRARRGW